MHAEQVLKSQFDIDTPAANSCMLNRLKNTISYITCSQIMHAEQVQNLNVR